ncbi:MAG: type II toxin-antitoxin system RelE/ParE family toxin [Marinirhabdus sp.]
MTTYQIVLTDEAKENIAEALRYYLGISNLLQQKFQAELINTIDRLKDAPKHHQIRYRGIRIAHTKTFSYGVHFIIEGTTIRVLKILHHKQFYK